MAKAVPMRAFAVWFFMITPSDRSSRSIGSINRLIPQTARPLAFVSGRGRAGAELTGEMPLRAAPESNRAQVRRRTDPGCWVSNTPRKRL